MDDGAIVVQHAMSDADGCGHRADSDVFSSFRHDYESLVEALTALS